MTRNHVLFRFRLLRARDGSRVRSPHRALAFGETLRGIETWGGDYYPGIQADRHNMRQFWEHFARDRTPGAPGPGAARAPFGMLTGARGRAETL
jgi:hypothetical protein